MQNKFKKTSIYSHRVSPCISIYALGQHRLLDSLWFYSKQRIYVLTRIPVPSC